MRGLLKKFTRCALVGALMLTGQIAHALTAGDVAVIAVNADNDDSFAFVALVDIPANTTITFTDNAWTTASGPFAATEGYCQWSHTSLVAAGTVIRVTGVNNNWTTITATTGSVTVGSSPGFSTDGDQIIAFADTWANRPTSPSDNRFLFAFSLENFLTTGSTTAQQSYLPSALSGASVAMSDTATETDNANFANGSVAATSVTLSDTKANLLSKFTNTALYYKNNTGPLTFPTYSFTVSGAPAAPTVTLTAPAVETLTVPNATATQDLAGTSSDAVGFLRWTNSLTHAFGSVAAGATWSVSAVALDVGDNAISITATNAAGTAASDSVTVTREPALLPAVTLTSPSSMTVTVVNATSAYDVTGTAQNLVGTMTWSNSLTAAAGSFAAATDWSVSGIALGVGDNVITFSGTNVTGSAASDAVTVRRTPVQVLAVGDIAFVAYNADGQDGFAIAALKDIPANTTIYFCDTEWSGSAFTAGEGNATWTTPATVIPVGTVVRFYLGTNDTADVGTLVDGMALGNSDEGVFCYLGFSPTEPTTFLAAVGNGTESLSFGTLSGTGLTLGNTAFLFGGAWDVAQYTGPRAGQTDFAAYRASVYTPANWEHQDATGDQNADSIAPDEPFDATPFTVGTLAATLAVTTADAVVANGTASYTFAGTAANAVGMLTLANSLGGTVERSASAIWTFENVALAVGVNTFTLTASNAVGAVVTGHVTIIRQAAPASGTVIRLASFSDPHYFATNLLISNGSAFQTYLAQDRKLITESVAITKATVDQLIAQNPTYVLVTGDLTKDGELDSHLAFAGELARLEAAGAQVLVIPGNHDINSSGAVSYDGANTTPVANVSPEQFKSIYAQFGYDLASATDPASVAYAVELSPTRTMICMDSCQYGATAGSFDEAHLAWITNRIAVAHAAGKLVVGMMHHGLLEHFQGQKSLFSEYVLDGYTTVAPLFASLGMKAVFTGHFHANDIVSGTFAGKTIYDIETGSTVTWPCPFRVMELDAQGTLSVATHTIEAIAYELGSAPDFETYAYDYLKNGMLGISAGMLQYQFGLDAGTAAYLAPSVTEALIAHYAGDESFAAATPTTQAIVGSMLGSPDPLTRQLGGGIYSILTDLTPADNSASLDLSTPPVRIASPANGTTVSAASDSITLTAEAFGLVGQMTFRNVTLAQQVSAAVGTGVSVSLSLAYGLNELIVSGTNAAGAVSSATVTVTRSAPTPAGGTNVSPVWNSSVATGAVHIAWTTNDWYQLQNASTCLPGEFLFRDPFGGGIEPGNGAPEAATLGATRFVFDAADGTRCAAVEANADLSVWVPSYDASLADVQLTQDVWLQVSYWDIPGNPEWVQGFQLAVTTVGGSASAPLLAGRTHGADGLITEAYSFTVTNIVEGFSVSFAANPALSDLNPALVSEIVIDTLAHAPLLVTSPVDGTSVGASSASLSLSVSTENLVGNLTFRNATTGYSVVVAVGAGSPTLPLDYGVNVLTVSGTNAAGQAFSDTVTVARDAPVPAGGTELLPSWNTSGATGTVHVAWTTNDWYQLQTANTCLPGMFLYRDPFGGAVEPGSGDPEAATLGATHYQYDAADGTRCAAVEANGDISVRVPCYSSSVMGLPVNQEVWLQVAYWDLPGNPGWVQGLQLNVTAQGAGAGATVPVLMGRTHVTNGLITEAYAFTVTNDATAFVVSFAADPALSAVNPAFVSDVTVDVRASSAVPSHVIRTFSQGDGTVNVAAFIVAHGANTNIVLTAGEWNRVQTLTTNGVAVAAAANTQSYTLELTNVTQDYDNRAVFGYRANSANPDSVPTTWLAGFGRRESVPFVTADRTLGDKYLLNLNPYEKADVLFDIADIAVTGGVAEVTVRLKVDGADHPTINGQLSLESRLNLTADWAVEASTPVTGTVFENGLHRYTIAVGTNGFFRALVR